MCVILKILLIQLKKKKHSKGQLKHVLVDDLCLMTVLSLSYGEGQSLQGSLFITWKLEKISIESHF